VVRTSEFPLFAPLSKQSRRRGAAAPHQLRMKIRRPPVDLS
jgi:hypothetical protein